MGEERKETSKGGERVFVGDRVQAAQMSTTASCTIKALAGALHRDAGPAA